MNAPRSTYPPAFRRKTLWSPRPSRSRGRLRRTHRLPGRARQRLGLLLLLTLAGLLWWGESQVPRWLSVLPARLDAALHQPMGWLELGLTCLALGALLALGWWGCTRLQRWRQVRATERAQMLQHYTAVDPLAFEHLVGHLFARDGYDVRVTKASGDKGIDLWLQRSGQPAIPVQCKRYRSAKVGSPELQAFSGALRYAGASEGIFVTTARFTPQAMAWARQERIRLIDGPALARWQRRLDRRTSSERRAGSLAQED